jgi:hypothetical protein
MQNMKTQKQRTTKQQATGPRQRQAESLKTERMKPASVKAAARPGAVAVPNSVKRGAFDRMKKIFGLLQDGRYPNCTSLATEFEISLKTPAMIASRCGRVSGDS